MESQRRPAIRWAFVAFVAIEFDEPTDANPA